MPVEKYETIPEVVEGMVFTEETALEITKWIDSKGWKSRYVPTEGKIFLGDDGDNLFILEGYILVWFPNHHDFGAFEQGSFSQFFKKVEA